MSQHVAEPVAADSGGRVTVELAEAWLSEYSITRNPALRDRIVLAYLRLADRLAMRFHEVSTISREDLEQTARMGLVAAVNRYDPTRGVPFLSYAVGCIVGELKRSLRDTSWRVHVPRRVQDVTLRLLPEVDRLRARLCRSPTLAELAAELDTTEETVSEALEAAETRTVLSLDRPASDRDASFAALREILPAEAPGEDLEDLILLPEVIGRLPEAERLALILYFFHEQRQRDIGERLGCSQMQVSRLLARALVRLRAMLLLP